MGVLKNKHTSISSERRWSFGILFILLVPCELGEDYIYNTDHAYVHWQHIKDLMFPKSIYCDGNKSHRLWGFH
jgi:hypothetical protein